MVPKKSIRLLLLSMIAAIMPLAASAYDFMVDGLCYNINSDGTSVTVTYENTTLPRYTNLSGELVIPENVSYNNKTYTVTEIGVEAFYGCSGLTSVTISNSVTSIKRGAFSSCSALESLTIGNSVQTIPSAAIPYDQVFAGCSSLKTVIWNAKQCNDFSNYSPFYGLSSIESFIFGNKVVKIPKNVCRALTSLTSVIISNSVTRIGDWAFYGCSGLTSVTLPNSLKYINEQAFSGCSGLTSLTLPGSLFTIGTRAFKDCSSLTSMTIPSSVMSIGEGIFMNCSSLASIAVESGNTSYDSRDNCNAIIKNQVYDNRWGTLIAGCKNTIIPNTVRDIGEGAFSGCTGLNSVTIPHSVSYILHGSFSGCHFTSVTIPCTLVSNSEFHPLEGFNSDRWDTLTVVGNGSWTDRYLVHQSPYVANQSPITTLNIGSGITTLNLFIYSGNKLSLNVLNCYAETPPDLGQYTQEYVFSPSCYNGELHVPAGSAEAYSSAEFWKDFSNIIPDLTDKVTLDKKSASMLQGGQLKLNVTELPEGGEVIWCTTNPYVATVDASGTVRATGDGGCDIFATLASNPAVYGSCHINVNNAEIFEGYNGYLKFQVIDEENHEAALVGYNEAIGVDLTSLNWGIQFPDEPVQVPSVVTYAGEEYTVTEIADNALKGLGFFSNPQRYDNFYPKIYLPETVRRIGKHALQTNHMSPCTEVVFPHSLETLDDECLLQGGGGGTYMLHENVKEIGNNVFSGMMISIVFNNHDFELTPSMFNLDDLTTLCLWNENLSIASGTFNGMTQIDRLVLGVYPCSIASNAFGGSTQINKIAVYSLEPYDLPDDAFSSSIYQNTLLLVPAVALESYRNAPGWKNFANIGNLTSGDVNYDGNITASDITAIYSHMLEGDPTNISGCDVDGDGHITSNDVTVLYNMLIGAPVNDGKK